MIRQIKNILKFTLIISLVSLVLLTPPVNARRRRSDFDITDNFTFNSFTGDYYVTRDDNNLAKMHVVETLVAKFPDYDQNHGIKRIIPATNNGGKNIVISNPSKFQAKVKRNGNEEPYTVSFTDGNIVLKIGNQNTYVTGEQTYTIEYDFENVANDVELEKSAEDKENTIHKFQEIYWNANGSAWKQSFNSVTANVHVDKKLLPELYDITICFSGAYGSRDECDKTVETADGFTFTSKNLSRGEGLTFGIAFPENTFTPAPVRISYIAYFAFGGALIVLLTTIAILVRRYIKKIAPKRRFYKSLFTAPQFTPLEGYTIAEASNLYLKPAQNPKVAAVLELAVQKKIEIIKHEDGKKKLFNKESWAIRIKDLKGLSKEQLSLLNIMNGGIEQLTENQVIELKAHRYSSTLTALYKQFDAEVESSLRERKDLEPETKFFQNIKWPLVIKLVTVAAVAIAIIVTSIINQEWFINTFGEYGSVAIIENEILLNIAFYFVPAFFFIVTCGSAIGYRYMKYTNQGLEQANYLAGLETYIKMAEADRIKLLQSTKGADTSNQGIVKLYEKLLPYAIIFGQEKSWRKSLEHYYTLVDERDLALPLYYSFSSSSLRSLSSSLNSSVTVPGSGSGSGFSGGFSGGGGGGGGGGGW